MNYDLFSCDNDTGTLVREKPRQASAKEAALYAQWVRERRGLPAFDKIELQVRPMAAWPNRRDTMQGYYFAATFGARTADGRHVGREWHPATYEDGAYSTLMPGHDMHRARVTLEELGEAGEVVRSSTLPVEPKKGGVIWSRDDVRKAAGPVEKPGKRRKVAAAPTPDAAEPAPTVEMEPAEAVERTEPVEAPQAYPEPVKALSEAESGTGEPVSNPDRLPTADVDSLSALFARVEALESRVAALPADAMAPPIADAAPVQPQAERPARTAALERAIRRAWAERRARRGAEGGMAIHARRIESLEMELRLARDEQALDKQALAEVSSRAEQLARRGNQHRERRLRSARRARRMIDAARQGARGVQARAAVLQADFAKLRADLADPSQPERASDIARLVRERDEARTALAAVNSRNVALQRAVDDLAPRFEEMVSRVTRAEAAVRRAGLVAA